MAVRGREFVDRIFQACVHAVAHKARAVTAFCLKPMRRIAPVSLVSLGGRAAKWCRGAVLPSKLASPMGSGMSVQTAR